MPSISNLFLQNHNRLKKYVRHQSLIPFIIIPSAKTLSHINNNNNNNSNNNNNNNNNTNNNNNNNNNNTNNNNKN